MLNHWAVSPDKKLKMMEKKEIITTTIEYIAIDGEVFDSEQKCLDYEMDLVCENLPLEHFRDQNGCPLEKFDTDTDCNFMYIESEEQFESLVAYHNRARVCFDFDNPTFPNWFLNTGYNRFVSLEWLTELLNKK